MFAFAMFACKDQLNVGNPNAPSLETNVVNERGITTLAKGSGFLSIVESIRPDIILLDIFLGDADGRNLCYQMKLHPAYQNIPVILYSAGHISFSTIQKSKADEFIVKPFEIDQLLGKIKELLVI